LFYFLQYFARLKQWKRYCAFHDIHCWEASGHDVIGYLQSLRPLRNHACTIRSHAAAISFFYRLVGLEGFEADPAVKSYVRACSRAQERQEMERMRRSIRPRRRRQNALKN